MLAYRAYWKPERGPVLKHGADRDLRGLISLGENARCSQHEAVKKWFWMQSHTQSLVPQVCGLTEPCGARSRKTTTNDSLITKLLVDYAGATLRVGKNKLFAVLSCIVYTNGFHPRTTASSQSPKLGKQRHLAPYALTSLTEEESLLRCSRFTIHTGKNARSFRLSDL